MFAVSEMTNPVTNIIKLVFFNMADLMGELIGRLAYPGGRRERIRKEAIIKTPNENKPTIL